MPLTSRTPFAMVPLWIYNHPTVTPGILSLYVGLASQSYDRKTRKSIPDLMESTGLKKSAIYGGFNVLTACGAIERKPGGVFFLPLDPPDQDSMRMETDLGEVEGDSTKPVQDSSTAESRLLLARETREVPPSPIGAETQRPNQKPSHDLATLAYAQKIRPVIAAGRNGNAFCAVRDLIEAQLDAGESPEVLEKAINGGVRVWTTAGLSTAIAQITPVALRTPSGHAEPKGYDALRSVAIRHGFGPQETGDENDHGRGAVTTGSHELRMASGGAE